MASAMDTQPAVLQQIFGIAVRHPWSQTEPEQRWGQVRYQDFDGARVTLLVANHQIAKPVFVLAGALRGVTRVGWQAVIRSRIASDITDQGHRMAHSSYFDRTGSRVTEAQENKWEWSSRSKNTVILGWHP
jgi:hypothetical protein